jgi:predicted RNA methylase
LWQSLLGKMTDSLKHINWDGGTMGFDLQMINDKPRNEFYFDSLSDCKDKVVLDIGTGTGLLAVMAVELGARKVYTVEKNYHNYQSAKYFIEKSNLQNIIEVIHSDFLHLDKQNWTHDQIDIVISETFANDCFVENFAFFVDHACKNLNLSSQVVWSPCQIDLSIQLIDVPMIEEFNSNTQINQDFTNVVNQSIQNYRNNFHNAWENNIMPTANLSHHRLSITDNVVKSFIVDNTLKTVVDDYRSQLKFDHDGLNNPYLAVDWTIYNSNKVSMPLTGNARWRRLGFKINKQKSNTFVFKFNALSHALYGYQL